MYGGVNDTAGVLDDVLVLQFDESASEQEVCLMEWIPCGVPRGSNALSPHRSDRECGMTLTAVETTAPSTSTRLTLRASGGESAEPAVVRTLHFVNATGLGSRAVADLYGGEHFDINPRRGQFLVYDRHASSLVSRIILPLPTVR